MAFFCFGHLIYVLNFVLVISPCCTWILSDVCILHHGTVMLMPRAFAIPVRAAARPRAIVSSGAASPGWYRARSRAGRISSLFILPACQWGGKLLHVVDIIRLCLYVLRGHRTVTQCPPEVARAFSWSRTGLLCVT